MKFKTLAITAICFFSVSALVLSSCQRERDTDVSEGEETAMMERNGDDAVSITDQASTGQLSQFKKERGCGIVTVDTVSMPHVISVNFGTSNCLCLDGKNRRGIITRTFNGKFKDVNSIHTIGYNNYFVNDNEIKGYKKITNNGLNASLNTTYSIETKDTVIKADSAGTVTWQSNRTREYVAGFNTPIWSDDIFKVTGTGSGVKANTFTWSMNITAPLQIDNGCKYRIISGEVQIQPQGKTLRTLNYGSGSCDNDATVTINNTVRSIKFK